jgi:hypothetical protein
MQALEATPITLPPNLQHVLDNNSLVFEVPKGIPPSQGDHDHIIPLLLGSEPPNVHPYRYPFA